MDWIPFFTIIAQALVVIGVATGVLVVVGAIVLAAIKEFKK